MNTIIDLLISMMIVYSFFLFLLLPVMIIIVVLVIASKNKRKNQQNITYQTYQTNQSQHVNQAQQTYERPVQDYVIYPYRRKNILTPTEYHFYGILKEQCEKRSFIICPKVRMEDFLDVTCRKDHLKYRGYIKSRHIDFIICNQEMRMLCGIELDDATHYTAEAQRVDKFKNDVFKNIKIPLFRIYVTRGAYKEQIEAAFSIWDQNNQQGQK